jgi:hypothetical protein
MSNIRNQLPAPLRRRDGAGDCSVVNNVKLERPSAIDPLAG